MQLEKCLRLKIGPVSQSDEGGLPRSESRIGDQEIEIECIPQMAMQNNCMASDYQKRYAGFLKRTEHRCKNRHCLNSRNSCSSQAWSPGRILRMGCVNLLSFSSVHSVASVRDSSGSR